MRDQQSHKEVGVEFLRTRGRSFPRVVLWTLLLWVLLGLPLSLAQATTISIPDGALLGTDAVQLQMVGPGYVNPDTGTSDLAYGTYRVEFISAGYVPYAAGVTSYQNLEGQRIQASYNVTFGSFDGNPNVQLEKMLVFTSIRVGNPTSLTCSDLAVGGAFPDANFDYAPDSGGWTGSDLNRVITTNDSSMAGHSEVCNAEGDSFSSSLVFEPVIGESETTYQYTMEIEQSAAGIDTDEIANLKFLVQGYSAVPEPNTGLMLMLGLAGLHFFSRSRRRLS